MNEKKIVAKVEARAKHCKDKIRVLKLASIMNSSRCDYNGSLCGWKQKLLGSIHHPHRENHRDMQRGDGLDDFKKWLAGKRYESGNEERFFLLSFSSFLFSFLRTSGFTSIETSSS